MTKTFLIVLLFALSAGAQNRAVPASPIRAAVTPHSVILTWGEPTQPAGEIVASVCIYKDSVQILPCLAAGALTFTDTAVLAGETHTYFLTNTDTRGVMSANSPSTSVTIPGNPPPPITVTLAPTSAGLVTNTSQQFVATVTGSTTQTVTWTASCGGISSAGLFTAPSTAGTCSVTATAVAGGTPATAIVTVTAAPTYAIVPTPSTLTFTGLAGTTPACQTMTVWATPATAMPVTLAPSAAWITVTPTSGVTQVNPHPSVCVVTAGLAAGTYTGNITITATNGTGSNSPDAVPVTLTLSGAAAPSYTCAVASTTATGEVLTVTIKNFSKGQSIATYCAATHP